MHRGSAQPGRGKVRTQKGVSCTSVRPGLVRVGVPGASACQATAGQSPQHPVGAIGFGKSDSISLLSGEWNFVVTP